MPRCLYRTGRLSPDCVNSNVLRCGNPEPAVSAFGTGMEHVNAPRDLSRRSPNPRGQCCRRARGIVTVTPPGSGLTPAPSPCPRRSDRRTCRVDCALSGTMTSLSTLFAPKVMQQRERIVYDWRKAVSCMWTDGAVRVEPTGSASADGADERECPRSGVPGTLPPGARLRPRSGCTRNIIGAVRGHRPPVVPAHRRKEEQWPRRECW